MERTGNVLRAIFDSSDDVWFFISPAYSIIYYNQKAFENGKLLHGKELQPGDSILDYARDTKNNIDDSIISNLEEAANGKILRTEQHIEYCSTNIWTRSKYTPVYENGSLLGISILIEDITRQKLMEEDQARYQLEILKLSNKREEFVNIASHELKTPLTSLKASLQILYRSLEKGANFNEVKSFLDRSNASIAKLHTLISDLLDTNKIISGALGLKKSRFNIAELVEGCCDHVRMQGKHEIKVTGDLDLQIEADKDKIDQVLVNLINNAVKYAPKSIDIVVNIERLQEQAKISVQDFGPGIPAEKIKNLFKRYFQGETDEKHYSGMGLGLYICEGIIKQHEGEIGVETEVNNGSIFWFTLPIT
jgi:PAS domain S-box-containing protein